LNKINKAEERARHLLRLPKLGKAKIFYKLYIPSKIELNIIRWFGEHSSQKIANKLSIDKSYVYAVIEKFKNIYIKEELK